MSPARNESEVPFITVDQMREVDMAMVCDYGIGLVQMMENAGRGLAHLSRSRFLGGDPRSRNVVVLSGTGGNGGGGLVCARRLSGWGARVQVWLSASAIHLAEVTRHQLTILERIGVPIEVAGEKPKLPQADLIVDALIGYSLSGAPHGTAAALIRAANGHNAPVVALDVPSGVDAGNAIVYDPAIRAEATLTLALPKLGLADSSVRAFVGELYLADIGVPPELFSRPPLGLEIGPVFAKEDVIQLW